MTLLGSGASQQESPQQAPAPIVRTRPRPASQAPAQTAPANAPPADAPPEAAPRVMHPRPPSANPNDAPAEVAPLAPRVPRPHPVNPQSLSPAAPSITASRPAATAKQTSDTDHPATPTTKTAASPAAAPAPAAPAKLSPVLNRTYVVLDPAHGGADSGSRIGDNTLEKNVTLALAFRLRSLMVARGFTVVLTRDSDAVTAATPNGTPAAPVLSLDNRAGAANHFRPAACLLLHATGRGTGVHLYTSELEAAPAEVSPLPWLTAQAAWVPASHQLAQTLSSALGRSQVPLVSAAASVRPVDSLTCPAVVVELAPETSDPRSVNDAGYQDRVASAIAGALIFWQNQVQPPPKLTPPTPVTRPHHHTVPPVPTATENQP